MKSWFKKYWVYIALAISIGAFWLFKDFLITVQPLWF